MTGSSPIGGSPTAVIVQPSKSVGWAIVLGFFFGPLGMLYSTILGAILMGVVWVFVLIATLGLGLLFVHPICAVWSALAAQAYNRRLYARAAPISHAVAEGLQLAREAIYRECPHCKEQMRRDATVCPHCRSASAAWQFSDGVWWFKAADGWYWLDSSRDEWRKHETEQVRSD